MGNSVNAAKKMLGNLSSYMPKPSRAAEQAEGVETKRHAPTLSDEEIVRTYGKQNRKRLAEMISPTVKTVGNTLWPLLTRANQTGVYAEEVMKVYAPFALSIITNIGA